MSSYDKVVKLACKPKAAPPKAKYLDPIIAATWSDDGAVHDVCKALSPRFREPNSVVVFKALIVLHTMIRNGATDNVLSYLSSSEVLRLSNVSAGNWEGYTAPQNLQNYAVYLDSRIRAYRDLKHDAIRVQAESNRDMRNSASVEEDGYLRGKKATLSSSSTGPQRSKTIIGRKLRVMTVEKGLLRETKVVHKMIDTLVECRFYLDDLEDELTTTALRMLVKDLLILFQAGNEGVINVLEHYFEMSHIDAEEALAIYRHFCKQTEKVVEYLGVAKKLQNILNVPIPNLKHAPVSLAGALEEYLSDPNFEQNRIEYRTNKEASQKGRTNGAATSKSNKAPSPSPVPPPPTNAAQNSFPSSQPQNQSEPNKAVLDFFAGIEQEQPNMFNPQTNSPNSAYFQQQGAANPFVQMGMASQSGQVQMLPQPTGFIVPQQTAVLSAPNPFGVMQQAQQQPPSHLRLQPQPTGHRPFSSFLPPQVTGMPGSQQQQQQQTVFLQPQATGANPFRQSMLMPQTTGMAMFGVGSSNGMQPYSASFGSTNRALNGFPTFNGLSNPQSSTSLESTLSYPASTMTEPFSQGNAAALMNVPTRPASTPSTAFGPTQNSSSPPVAQPVKTHQTGTKNPFGPIITPVPPVPKPPTLMELAMGVGNQNQPGGQPQHQPQQSHGAPQIPQSTGFGSFSLNLNALNPGASDMSSIASSFSSQNPQTSAQSNFSSSSASGPLNSQNTSTTTSGSTFSDSFFSSLSTQPTGATNTSSTSSISFTGAAPLRSQTTGFSGLKPFKPSSSFGASLLESLPPITGSTPATPAITGGSHTFPSSSLRTNGIGSTNTGLPNMNFNSSLGSSSGSTSGFSAFGSQPTGLPQSSSPTALGQSIGLTGKSPVSGVPTGMGSTLGVGLRPQMTGGGANPFRASMFNATGNGLPAMPTGGLNGSGGPTSMSQPPSLTGGNMFGSSLQNVNPQQQQQQGASLI